jgi:hypothetical protein
MSMKTKQAWQVEFEPRLQLVQSSGVEPAKFLGMPCEFSLTRYEQCRNDLSEIGVRSQGSADFRYVGRAAIKTAACGFYFSSSERKTRKGERS